MSNNQNSMEFDEDSHDIIILGSAYTPYYGDNVSTLFNHNEMNSEFVKKLKDLPVFIEHDTKHQIGNVVDSYVNEKRQLKTLLHIHGNREVNKRLPATLYKDPENGSKGYYNSLSLGNNVALEQDENNFVHLRANVPSEVSVCMNGDRPMTEIDDYWFVPKGTDVAEFINTHIEPKIQRFNN